MAKEGLTLLDYAIIADGGPAGCTAAAALPIPEAHRVDPDQPQDWLERQE